MTGDDPLLAALAQARDLKKQADMDIRLMLAYARANSPRPAPTGWPTWPKPRAYRSPVSAPSTPRPTSPTPPA